MSRFYRFDGTPYEGPDAYLQWAKDLENIEERHVAQEHLWNGIWLSTVWLGSDHSHGLGGPPLIYETMAFLHIIEQEVEFSEYEGIRFPYYRHTPTVDDIFGRYSTLEEARLGHAYWKHRASGLEFTVNLWINMLMEKFYE